MQFQNYQKSFSIWLLEYIYHPQITTVSSRVLFLDSTRHCSVSVDGKMHRVRLLATLYDDTNEFLNEIKPTDR